MATPKSSLKSGGIGICACTSFPIQIEGLTSMFSFSRSLVFRLSDLYFSLIFLRTLKNSANKPRSPSNLQKPATFEGAQGTYLPKPFPPIPIWDWNPDKCQTWFITCIFGVWVPMSIIAWSRKIYSMKNWKKIWTLPFISVHHLSYDICFPHFFVWPGKGLILSGRWYSSSIDLLV